MSRSGGHPTDVGWQRLGTIQESPTDNVTIFLADHVESTISTPAHQIHSVQGDLSVELLQFDDSDFVTSPPACLACPILPWAELV